MGCLGGEGGTGAVDVAVATCPDACRPSLGCRGDVDDGTVKHPKRCRGRVIPCGRCTGVVPLSTDGSRGRFGT
jgi:hypothetical protein